MEKQKRRPETEQPKPQSRPDEEPPYTLLLDLSSNLAFVCAAEPRALLYANRAARQFIQRWFDGSEEACADWLYRNGCLLPAGTDVLENQEWQHQDRCYSIKLCRMRWQGREAAAIFGVDITQRKNAQRRLNREHALLQQRYQEELLDERDLTERYVRVARYNVTRDRMEKLEDSHGSSEDAQIGLSFSQLKDYFTRFLPEAKIREDFFHSFSPDYLQQQYQSGNDVLRSEWPFRTSAGAVLWLSLRTKLRRHPDTDDLIAFVVMHDITPKKQEAALLQFITSTELECIFCIDLIRRRYNLYSSGENIRLPAEGELDTMLFPAIEEWLGKEGFQSFRRRYTGKPLFQRLANKGMLSIPLSREKNGKTENMMIKAAYLDQSHTSIVVLCTNVTDLLAAEHANQRKIEKALNEANRANRAKSDFMSQISHDLRTPMNAIIGLNRLAMQDIHDPALLADYFKKIDSASKLLLAIINDVLDMERLDNAALTLNPTPYNLEEFLELMDAMIRPQCEQKGVKYVIDHSGYSVPAVLLDKTRFNQIFLNLLSNAVKFTPPGGSVMLRMQALLQTESEVQARFRVSDTGIGMSKAFMRRMFQPFTRERRRGYENIEGTGLGLSIAKRLTEQMGGRLSVESELNGGTTFTIDITMQKCSPERSQPTQPTLPLSLLDGRRALVCEDNLVNAQILINLLMRVGMQSDHAQNGAEGLQRFRDAQPGSYDIILMDIRMPVMDGITASQEIRALPRPDARTVPIVAITANAFEEERQQIRQAGMNAHLVKPVEPQALYDTLIRQMQRAQRLEEAEKKGIKE